MTEPIETGWWIEQGGRRFPIMGDEDPITGGEGLEPREFNVAIADRAALFAFNFKDEVSIRQHGALRLTGRIVDRGLRGGVTLLRGYDHWRQVHEDGTRNEVFINQDWADLVRRALGLRYNVVEDFADADDMATLTQTEVVGGVLRLKKTGSTFPTAGTMEAITKNRALGGDVSAVTLAATDRVGADPSVVDEDLDDNSLKDTGNAHYDADRAMIRLPSVTSAHTFPFDDYSQTEEVTGSAIVKGGKLTLAGDLLMETWEDEDLSDWGKTAEEWQDYDRIKEDLTTAAGIGRNETFSIGTSRYLLQALGAPGWKGWKLNPTDDKWDADSGIEAGLSGIVDKPDGFVVWVDGSTLYGIIIKHGAGSTGQATITGVRWNTGTSAWVSDAEAVDGISLGTHYDIDMARVERSGSTYLIIARGDARRHVTNFSEYSTGSAPSDWTSVGDSLLTVQTDAGGEGGKTLQGQVNSITVEQKLTWDDADNVADAELLVKFRSSWMPALDASGDQLGVLRVREGGSVVAVEVKAVPTNAQKVRLFGSGIDVTVDSALAADTWYWFRLRLEGTAVKLRFWQDGSSEPGTWNTEQTANGSTAGKWGVWAKRGGLVTPTVKWDKVQIIGPNDTVSYVAWKRNTGTGVWESDAVLATGLANVTRTKFGDAAAAPYLSYAGIQGKKEEDHVLLLAFNDAGIWTYKAHEWDEVGDTWGLDANRWGGIPNDQKVSVAAFYWLAGYYAVASSGATPAWSGHAISSKPVLETVGTGQGTFTARMGGRGNTEHGFDGTVKGTLHIDAYPYGSREAFIDLGPETFQLKVTTGGALQYRKSDGTYAALPTATTLAQDDWNNLDLRWDTGDADPANWKLEVFVGAASKGSVAPYKTTVREIAKVRLGYSAGNATAITHGAAFDDIVVYPGTTQGALTGDWISKTYTDPAVLHQILINPTQNLPSGAAVAWSYSQDGGTTWVAVSAGSLNTVLALPRNSATYKLKAALSAASIVNAPDVSTLVVNHDHTFASGNHTWNSKTMGSAFKPAKMRLDFIDANGQPAKVKPSGTTISIVVSPDGGTTTQSVAEGVEASFDTSLTGAADGRVNFTVSTSDQQKTPEIHAFRLTMKPDGSGQTATYYVRRDGATWHEVQPGVRFAGFGGGESPKDKLELRTVFTNSDPNSSPEVDILSATVETAGSMTGIEEGTITALEKVARFESQVETFATLLERIIKVTGIHPKRTFDQATGKITVDWNVSQAATVHEIVLADLEDPEYRESVEGQASRVVYIGA